VLKALAIVKWLLVNVLLMFISAILLNVVPLLVIVLTMFQMVLGLLVDFNNSLSKYILFAVVITEDRILQ